MEDVKNTVPKQYQDDFMRGYLWNYKIDTRILNKEYLSINAKNKNITNTSETKDAILMQNKKVAKRNNEKRRVSQYDVIFIT